MRRCAFALLGVTGVCLMAGHGGPQGAEAAAVDRARAQPAVVIVEGTRVYDEPGVKSKIIMTVNCGDIVLALGYHENGQLKVQVEGTEGWVYDEHVIGLFTPAAPAQLVTAAWEKEQPREACREPDYLSALALYSRMIELLHGSYYDALALWRFGQVAERLAAEATRRAKRELTEEEQRMDTFFVGWKGLDQYRKWGLTFEFSHLGRVYHYGGDVYRKLVKEHPDSEWADNAAYELVTLSRAETWEGHPKGPQQQLARWIEFTKRYPRSELMPKALLEMAYLNRALYEIYSYQEQFADSATARACRESAEALCEKVKREFFATEHAARAEVNLAELAGGRNVYVISR